MNWNVEFLATIFCYAILLAPLLAMAVTAAIAVLELPASERSTNRVTQAAIAIGLMGGLGMLALMLVSGRRSVSVELGEWISLPQYHFQFAFTFLFDRLSVAFLLLSLGLSGIVGTFARTYLHREPGYRRFYLLFMVFVLGMSVSSIAGTIETLFIGWELVGLSSALLVGYFQERTAPVHNGLRVWVVYRFADAAFLIAAVALHHVASEGDFVRMTGGGIWPHGAVAVSASEALVVGTLLLVAAAGKSALLPFSGWLPRAMEGPTPSSAIFYGALSVHLGALLLLRVGVLLERSVLLGALVVASGLATAAWASFAARSQSDIKSILALSSLTQVGLIVAEIGLGLRFIPLVHIIGHACLRTLQFLRAPSLLHDYHRIERAIGTERMNVRVETPIGSGGIAYEFGYDQSLFDIAFDRWLVDPYARLMFALERAESRWMNWLKGAAADGGPRVPTVGGSES